MKRFLQTILRGFGWRVGALLAIALFSFIGQLWL